MRQNFVEMIHLRGQWSKSSSTPDRKEYKGARVGRCLTRNFYFPLYTLNRPVLSCFPPFPVCPVSSCVRRRAYRVCRTERTRAKAARDARRFLSRVKRGGRVCSRTISLIDGPTNRRISFRALLTRRTG